MAQSTPADKRRVYLANRAIFTGDKAQLRQLKKVRKVIDNNKTVLRPLIRDLGADKVVEIARDLLERRIFESELRAKIEFPELFHSSPNQEIQREASEIDAARSVTEAINEITSVDEGADTDDELGQPTVIVNGINGVLGTAQVPNSEKTSLLPSLYPIYVPYRAQHVILNEAQRLLEESCFEFIQKWLPSTLEEKGWECASSAELTKSTRLLAVYSTKIPKEAFVNLGNTSLTEILFATSRLRHSAVHRLPNTARGIRDLCRCGYALAATLGDHVRAAQLDDICNELDDKIEAMKLNKNALEDTATAGLDEIRRQREELDRREKEIIAQMVKEDKQNKAFMGVLLEESVHRILAERLPDIDEVSDEQSEREDKNDTRVEVGHNGGLGQKEELGQNGESAQVKSSDETTKEAQMNGSWHPAWRTD